MNSRKKICIVNQDKIVNELFSLDIKNIFKNSLYVYNYSTDELLALDNKDIEEFVLFIVPCSSIKGRIERRFNKTNVITAKLTLSINNIKELLTINENAHVAVVMSLEETAMDTISTLKEMGFDKFNYYSYWPGKDNYYEDYDVAITAGVPHLVRGNQKKIIDLGPRQIDLMTIFEIIVYLDLPLDIINELSRNYISKLVGLSINLSSYTKQLIEVETFMGKILNNVDCGIIALDIFGGIKYINEQATTLINRNIKIGNSIVDLPFEMSKLTEEALYNKESIRNKVIETDTDTISFDSFPVLVDDSEELGSLILLKSVTSIQESEKRVRSQLYKKGYYAKYKFNNIIGQNHIIKQSIELAKKIAVSNLSVLIIGESGTGKEIFAQAIHNYSPRNKYPFVAINFAGLQPSLIESELFGYNEGAFTGAKKGGHLGLIEQARGGTLFLDEIGDASLEIQIRLLRFLDEKRIIRVGGSESIPVDVRIIAATNKQLQKLMQAGKFRDDLYYRLNVASIFIPPLRERREDIPLIIEKILSDSNASMTFDKELVEYLKNCLWPGNIRQLKNMINYILVANKGKKTIALNDAEHILGTIQGEVHLYQNNNIINPQEKNINNLDHESNSINKLILYEVKANPDIGRYKIYTKLTNKGYYISEYKIRKALKSLEKQGYISIGETKQGTRLTDKGLQLLAKQYI